MNTAYVVYDKKTGDVLFSGYCPWRDLPKETETTSVKVMHPADKIHHPHEYRVVKDKVLRVIERVPHIPNEKES